MASENETVADIVREMRNDAIAADAWHETYGEMASAASTLNRHADRIEKAHNRELAAKDAEIAELRQRLKVAEDYIAKLAKIDTHPYSPDSTLAIIRHNAKNALAAIREPVTDCNQLEGGYDAH